MKTEDLVVDEGGEGKIVEEVCEVLPNVGVAVFSKALVIEAIDLCNLARLVVAAEDGDALGVSNLEGDKERDRLNGVIASVDVIAWLCVKKKKKKKGSSISAARDSTYP